ncbi:uncharacterized protein HD556DRAFT_1448169 [Suillus plorans]|uniref:Uncharacterized protein n=1 Tax=Suillus plorans TaxID=116603 RepID=A0A9P7DD54_9AGAM|nr:uncharacterized protein HD556DRAFT_1448169 [Suillus plorans]KAG1788000.1 hypothetical protein HD556DRAFT_1448169 [Suillus plorans]
MAANLGQQEWQQIPDMREWLRIPSGKAWQSTPAASVWLNMEEFSSTLEVIDEYIIVPESTLLPTFQAVQQFKSLPDSLAFPVLLSLGHPSQHLSRIYFRADMKIGHAIASFMTFANEAQNQSQSASGALKYARQNWIMHLLQGLNPWDDKLNHIFQSFWDRCSLSWLERQWWLKGLQSCLIVLSEGQKLDCKSVYISNHYLDSEAKS